MRSKDVRRRAERGAPVRFRDHDRTRRARPRIRFVQETPQARANAERCKEIAGNDLPGNRLRQRDAGARGHPVGIRTDRAQRLRELRPIQGVRQARFGAVLRRLVVGTIEDEDQLRGIVVRKRREQHRLDRAEDRGADPDRECKRGDHDCGREPRLRHQTQRKGDIAPDDRHVFVQRGRDDVEIGGKRETHCLRSIAIVVQTRDLLGERRRGFLAVAAPKGARAEPQERAVERDACCHRRYASPASSRFFRTSLTMLSSRATSTASALRPPGVSR